MDIREKLVEWRNELAERIPDPSKTRYQSSEDALEDWVTKELLEEVVGDLDRILNAD